MPRQARAKLGDHSLFHVTARAATGERLFAADADRILFLDLVAERFAGTQLRVASFCLLGTHLHLLVHAPVLSELSAAMRDVEARYAEHVNRQLGRHGRVFRDRFGSRAVHRDGHAVNGVRYIERNALLAGIVDHPLEYPFQSYAMLLGLRPPPPFLDPEYTLTITNGIENLVRIVEEIDDCVLAREVIAQRGLAGALEYGYTERQLAEALGMPRTTLQRRIRDERRGS